MASIAMDFFAVARLVEMFREIESEACSQLITTRAGVEVDDSSSNGKVFVKSSTGPAGRSVSISAFALRM